MSVQSPHGAHKWRPGPLEAQQPARVLPSSWPRRSVSPRRLVSSLNGPQVAQPIAPLLSIYWLLQHAGYRHMWFFCCCFFVCFLLLHGVQTAALHVIEDTWDPQTAAHFFHKQTSAHLSHSYLALSMRVRVWRQCAEKAWRHLFLKTVWEEVSAK